MTIRSSDRKAPKVARLELHRETLRELTESETAEAAGGQVFKPRLSEWCPSPSDMCFTRGLDCITIWATCGLKCTNSGLCR